MLQHQKLELFLFAIDSLETKMKPFTIRCVTYIILLPICKNL